MADQDTVGNAVKLVGEVAVVPGTSQLLDGNVPYGIGYAVLGLAARALLGPVGLLLVAADSFSSSVSGKHLHEQVTGSN